MLRPKKQSLKPKLKHRPFLKWAGGKFRLTDDINKAFPNKKDCLIEPFVGAGAVFLNSNFERYILADINPDLINLFNIVKENVEVILKLVSRFSSQMMLIHPIITIPNVVNSMLLWILSNVRLFFYI